jgi:hypothetical protein
VMIGLLLAMQTRFQVTDQVLDELQSESVPQSVLSKLDSLKNKSMSQEDMTREIARVLNPEEQERWKDKIMLHAGMQHRGWFSGDGPISSDFPLTVRQMTIFFTVYVFFQVWNQINCRSLSLEESGFHRLLENPQFLLVASLTVVGQVLIVTLGGKVFHVEPLGLLDWLAIAAATASVLVFAEFARQIRLLRSPGLHAAAK